MNIIDFSQNHCKNCYKCLRNCELQAIAFKDSHAHIMSDKCILCGRCLEICPQNKNAYISDLATVKSFLKSGLPVIASLAPSYLGVLDQKEPGQVITALKQLGFSAVRETAEGAVLVTAEYERLFSEGRMENIITTCCPSANDLIEIYYPALVPYMAPVVSPMIAHGMILRKAYPENAKIVFIGPCISKKKEAEEDPRTKGYIDAVLNFNELEQWLREEGISLSALMPSSPDNADPGINRLYPVSRGVLASVLSSMRQPADSSEGNGDFSAAQAPSVNELTDLKSDPFAPSSGRLKDAYRMIQAHGLSDCMELLKAIQKGDISHCFVELNACHGGCIKGPGTTKSRTSSFRVQMDMEATVNRQPADPKDFLPESVLSEQKELRKKGSLLCENNFLTRRFSNRSVHDDLPSEEMLAHILHKFGKTKPEDMLNCGACGYPTCREKAIAVFQGKAEIVTCLPYMIDRAQSMSNMVMDITPNIIIIVDSDMRIVEFSKAAEYQFGTSLARARDMYLQDFIDPSDFLHVLKTHESILGKRVIYDDMNLATLQNIVYMPEQNCVLGIFQDVTAEEEQNRQAYKVKMDTIEMAQRVIDKQMLVAQEIAGLLGETTAETKVTLTKLRDTITHDGKTGGAT